MEVKKRYILDIILIIIAMTVAVLVRLPSAFDNLEKYRSIAAPKELSQEFIDGLHTEEGNPYLYDPDSYFYAKQAFDLNQEPSLFSNFGNYNLLPFTTVTTYKLLNPLTHISLETLICYIGPFIFALSCIPAYIFVKRKTNRFGGFTAAILLGTSPILVGFTMATRFDTDILLTLLPTTMLCSYIIAIETKNRKKSLACLFIATLSFLLLAFTWESSFIYAIIAIFISLITILTILIKNKFKLKPSFSHSEFKIALIFPLLLILTSLIMHDHLRSIINIAALTISGGTGFPSPGAYVSELNSCPLYSGDVFHIFDTVPCGIVNSLGAFPLVITLGVIIILFAQKNFTFLKNHNQKTDPLFLTSTILIIWLLVGTVSSSFGMRFIKNAAIPAALLAGIGLGILYEKIHTSWRGKIILLLVWVLVCLPSFRSYAVPEGTVPSVDDSLTTTNSWINENIDNDYTIASWWDYGYYYEYGTNLKVLADGGTYDSHVYYWLANAFLTEDELLSSRIFKMLANSNLQAPELAKSIVGDYANGSRLLKQILVMPKDEAKSVLTSEHSFTNEQADSLLELTHQDAKVIVIITKNMLSIMHALTFYGCWSFNEQYPPTEPACLKKDEDSTTSRLSHPPYIIYRLYYEDKDTDCFTHANKIDSPTNSLDLDPNIWIVK